MEGLYGALAAAETLDHVAVFEGVAVGSGLVFEDRHKALLRGLLLDQVLALAAGHVPGQEDLEAGVQRISNVALPEKDPLHGDEGPLVRRWAD